MVEVKKSANHCFYYAENLPKFLKDDIVKTEAKSWFLFSLNFYKKKNSSNIYFLKYKQLYKI